MEKIIIDKYTKEQAIDYANNEADLYGFKVGSDRWKKAFKEYLSFAFSTMSVGRNPRGSANRYQVLTSLYPEIFGSDGFSGKVARNFLRQDGETRGVDLISIQNRVLSAVNNLMRLYENGVLGTKNTAKVSKAGKIDNKDMSELQFPNKEEFANDMEFEAAVRDVAFNWLVRDLITNAILESLSVFLRLTKADVDFIMGNLQITDATVKDLMKSGRAEFVKMLRAQVKHKFDQINYRKLVSGGS